MHLRRALRPGRSVGLPHPEHSSRSTATNRGLGRGDRPSSAARQPPRIGLDRIPRANDPLPRPKPNPTARTRGVCRGLPPKRTPASPCGSDRAGLRPRRASALRSEDAPRTRSPVAATDHRARTTGEPCGAGRATRRGPGLRIPDPG